MSEQQKAGPLSFADFVFRIVLATLVWVELALVIPPLTVETDGGMGRYLVVTVLWLITSAVLTGKSFGDALVATIIGAGIYVGALFVIAIILALVVGRDIAGEWITVGTIVVGSLLNVGWLYATRRGAVIEFGGEPGRDDEGL